MKTLKFPELHQVYNWDCGASAMQSVLTYWGFDVREEVIMKVAKTSSRGTPIVGMKAVAKKFGLVVKSGTMTIGDIKKFLDRKIPVVLLIQAWSGKKRIKWENDWLDGHYVVAIGYSQRRIYFEDPWTFSRTFLTLRELEKRWHDVDRDKKKHFNWGLAAWLKNKKTKNKNIKHLD
jgi:ABC-type bacteriocin/lantibiotic exporter with double-glycine peptidase domain